MIRISIADGLNYTSSVLLWVQLLGHISALCLQGCPNSNGLINTGRQKRGVAVVAVAVNAGIPRCHSSQSYALIMLSQSSPKAKNSKPMWRHTRRTQAFVIGMLHTFLGKCNMQQ